MRVTKVTMEDYTEGKSEYKIKSAGGCCAIHLMPQDVLDDLIEYLAKCSKEKREYHHDMNQGTKE